MVIDSNLTLTPDAKRRLLPPGGCQISPQATVRRIRSYTRYEGYMHASIRSAQKRAAVAVVAIEQKKEQGESKQPASQPCLLP